ncbi:MAG: flagellar biosynthetic protein FliR [Rhodospirillales bacterium]|nr:flagellar biosynthetic protein FliR [Rhodospirillales bacterium]
MLSELLTLNIFGFFLIFARVGTAFLALPGFSAAYVTVRLRLLIALAVSFVVAPLLIPDLPVIPATPTALFLLFLGEIVIGGFFGAIGRITVGALHVAGTVIAYLAGMANAFIQDPVAEAQGSIISGFLTTTAIVLIFISDMHHLMLRAVTESYAIFQPGEPFSIPDMAFMIARRVSDTFTLGVQLASPFLLTGITHFLMLGLLGRLLPNLPVFFFGLPIQIATQIIILSIVLSGIMLMFMTSFGEVFQPFVAP